MFERKSLENYVWHVCGRTNTVTNNNAKKEKHSFSNENTRRISLSNENHAAKYKRVINHLHSFQFSVHVQTKHKILLPKHSLHQLIKF